MIKFAFSGGFGDAINVFCKVHQICKEQNIKPEDVHITYLRDLVDEQIIKDSTLVKSSDYESWVKYIAEIQGWKFDVEHGNVNEYFKENKDKFDYILGTHFSKMRIPDQQRNGFIGNPPNEYEMDFNLFPVRWKVYDWEDDVHSCSMPPIDKHSQPTYDKKLHMKERIYIAIHSEFSDERKNITRGWKDIVEYIDFINKILEAFPEDKVMLFMFGRTNKDLSGLESKFNKNSCRVINYINSSIKNQYELLAYDADCVISFSGWAVHLPASAGKKVFMFQENEVASELYHAKIWKESGALTEWKDLNNKAGVIELIKDVINKDKTLEMFSKEAHGLLA